MARTWLLLFAFAIQGNFVLAADLPELGILKTPTPISTTPGQFDSYNLSLTYHNDYCVENPKEAECDSSHGPVIKGLVLHGLWPDRQDDPKSTYGYCGLPASQVNSNWCAASIDIKSQIPTPTFSDLLAYVPGTDTCLYNHEWYAHGTCSTLTIPVYFADALTIVKNLPKLAATEQLVNSSAGKTLDRSAFTNAFMQDLGANASDSAIVLCRQSGGTSYFTGMTIGLDKQNFMQFPALTSLATLKPYNGQKDVGNCPETGIVVSK